MSMPRHEVRPPPQAPPCATVRARTGSFIACCLRRIGATLAALFPIFGAPSPGVAQPEYNNMVINADFESGYNTGYETQYGRYDAGLFACYAIRPRPEGWNGLFLAANDHTYGDRVHNMMMFNGDSHRVAWDFTFNVSPNTDYRFSLWWVALYPDGWPAFRVSFRPEPNWDGTYVAPLVDTSNSAYGQWHQSKFYWNSGTETIVTVIFEDVIGVDSGNDFAIDDLYLSENPEPVIKRNPDPRNDCIGGEAKFTVEAKGKAELLYQWRRNGAPLYDGFTWSGSFVSGATMKSLKISGLSADDVDSYDCRVTNGEGEAISAPATLDVHVSHADFNMDGFLDGIDYDLFNNLFESGDPAADYNGDGFVDGIDYDLFTADFENGCP